MVGWDIFRALLPYLAYLFSSLIKLTTRTTTVRGEIRARLRREDARFIYAFWHQRQAFFTVSHRGDKMTVLISGSRDGQLISETIRLCCGVRSIRGSSSKGASAAVRSMMAALEAGFDLGITPDGPRGPAREIKAGVMFLAQKLGVPILPITSAQSRRLIFARSWDRFHFPLPFGRAAVVYGDPIRVGPGDDLPAKTAQLKTALDAITLEAEALVA
jgi:lysophospholipid acyltransferase (LPLAT)-like uncharacterized protein